MKKLFLIITLSFFAQTISAQSTVFEEGRTIYKRENAFGVVIHTRGWGLTYKYGIYTSGFSRRTYEVDLVGVKHSKEKTISSNSYDNSNGYVYGKLNSIILLRAGIGQHSTFISKQSVRGVSISYILNGGLSLAYAKPVYLEVVKIDTTDGQIITEIEKYDPDIHSQGDIIGKASWFRGLFGGKFYPGVFVKAGLSFESSKQASKINALEVGAVLDVYLQKVPLMANEFNQYYFFNLYVSLTFGSKKTE
jgi:hypothetical protein